MNIYDLERKFGKFAIPNLSLYIVCTYALGYVIELALPGAYELITLNPYEVIHNLQIWRIFTWLLIPPYSFGIFTIINIFFIYSIGRLLERIWGSFRYTFFVFSGVLFVLVGAFLIYVFGGMLLHLPAEVMGKYISNCTSTYYINVSVIMAFAMTVPDMQVRFMFIIPIKMKVLAYIEAAFILLDIFQYLGAYKIYAIVPCGIIILSVLNFIILMVMNKRLRNPSGPVFKSNSPFKTRSGPKEYKGFSVHKGDYDPESRPMHKCAVCGVTEKDAPNITFRYCSKCKGSFEYCEDHIFTHTHVE